MGRDESGECGTLGCLVGAAEEPPVLSHQSPVLPIRLPELGQFRQHLHHQPIPVYGGCPFQGGVAHGAATHCP